MRQLRGSMMVAVKPEMQGSAVGSCRAAPPLPARHIQQMESSAAQAGIPNAVHRDILVQRCAKFGSQMQSWGPKMVQQTLYQEGLH